MALSLSQAFGLAVREIRVARGLSQDDAALMSGVDRAYFGHIERATKSPTLKTIARITAALDVRPSDVFARAERIRDEANQPGG